MRILLDTQALIWFYEDKSKLSKAALNAIEDKDNERYISIVSIWEMNIKAGLGKLKLSAPIPDVVSWYWDEGMELLPVMEPHAHGVRMLPSLHKDPFDRMLVSQARCDGLTIVTVDERIQQYTVGWLW